ncbi:MAG: transposase, partial [Bacteroidota bacterium]
MLKQGVDRNQLQMFSLEVLVEQNSIVRVIDAFVDMLNLEELGFIIKGQIDNGAPAFPAPDLLKLLYYGYLHQVRTSRPLAREARTNLEAMWLTKCLQPGYRTICSFRADNVKPLQKAFYQLNAFLKKQDLFDLEEVAIDGAKFRAQNSKKNN